MVLLLRLCWVLRMGELRVGRGRGDWTADQEHDA